MRVVHISKVKGIAGSERHLLTLLPGLARRGVEPTMLVLEEPAYPADDFAAEMAACGVPVLREPVRGHLDATLTGRLAARFRALRPEVVHTHLVHADLYGLPAAHRAGVPVAISSRHNDNPFRRNPLVAAANRRAMRRADRVIAISGALAAFVREVERIPGTKVVTIRYGLDAPSTPPLSQQAARAALGLADAGPLIGFFGRLIPQKGVDVLLQAFALLAGAHPDARLVLVGDGAERAALEALSARLGLADRVTFAGWQPDAARLMPAADVVAMPSRWEGFGLVALEAMAAGRALVASRVSALPEIVVDGETGRLVPPDDAGTLAEALGDLLADPARGAALGQAGRARLESDFAADTMVERTLDLYRALVEQKRAGA